MSPPPAEASAPPPPYGDWEPTWVTATAADRVLRHAVYSAGDGPDVVLLHELPGAGPSLFALADQLRAAGYRVHVPVLYGEVGVGETSQARMILRARFCLWGELHLFATARTSPLVTWLRALATAPPGSTPGSDVAVIGMCMTGSLVLGLLATPEVAAGIAAQPSLPFVVPFVGSFGGLRERGERSFGLDPDDEAAAIASTTPLLTLRYADDDISPAQRTERLVEEFASAPCTATNDGDRRVRTCGRLTAVELPGDGHSTITSEAGPGAAVGTVLAFLGEHHPTGG